MSATHHCTLVKLLKKAMTLYISHVINDTPTIANYPRICDKCAFRICNMCCIVM